MFNKQSNKCKNNKKNKMSKMNKMNKKIKIFKINKSNTLYFIIDYFIKKIFKLYY